MGAHQDSLNIANTEPSHHALSRLNESKAQYHTSRCPESLVASLYERDNRLVGRASEKGGCCSGGIGRCVTVPYAVNGRYQNSVSVAADQVLVTRFALARKNEFGNAIFDHRLSYCFHFFTATVVPRPGWEVISNSSIKRRTPGSPSPRLPEVEKPSRVENPSSAAITRPFCRAETISWSELIAT